MAKKPEGKESGISLQGISSKIKTTDLNTYFIFGAILLVLVVGIYAIFSPQVQNLNAGNPACGKIVIAADGPRLSNNVAPSLSEARFFLVVNPLSRKLMEVIRNPYRSQQPNPQIVYLIAGKGEEAVIVSGIDQQSYNMLMQFGIRVFGGYQGQAGKAVSLYRQARISQASPTVDAMQQTPAMGMMAQQNIAQPAAAAGWGMQGIAGNGTWNPYCQVPPAQAGLIPDVNMGPDWGMQPDMPVDPGMTDMNMMANQAAWGDQPFVCPNCNWRLRCPRQGNSYPNCPNCNSPMAMDMSGANKAWKWWSDGQWAAGQQAANMTQLRPQFNAQTNQPNFWQGQEATGYFVCPNCNWRMYSQQGQNQYPRCPNCKQIMARSGAYYQRQNVQNNAAGSRVALQTQAMAPPIFRDAVMPHAYRGVCENCHIVRSDIPIASNAQMPHPYRGVCSNCHQIQGVAAGASNNQAVNTGVQAVNAWPQNQDTARVAFGSGR